MIQALLRAAVLLGIGYLIGALHTAYVERVGPFGDDDLGDPEALHAMGRALDLDPHLRIVR